MIISRNVFLLNQGSVFCDYDFHDVQDIDLVQIRLLYFWELYACDFIHD